MRSNDFTTELWFRWKDFQVEKKWVNAAHNDNLGNYWNILWNLLNV